MADEGKVKLLGGWASPYVMRPRIALNIKLVDYEFLEETPGSKSQLLLESNPVHKKIPVLIHQGRPVCESLIIVEYIDEVWPSGPSILPSDPYDRYTARFWAAYLDEKFFPTVRAIGSAADDAAKKSLFEQLEQGLALVEDAFEKCSRGKAFFGGEQMGYLDIAFGAFLGWLRAVQVLHSVELLNDAKTPHLRKWSDNFSSHPAVKDVLPSTDKLVDFAKNVLSKLRAATPSN